MIPAATDLSVLTRTAAQRWGDRVAWTFDLPRAERTFAEVEAVLQDHPAVGLAACIAVPDELRQEEVKAFLVPAAGVPAADVDIGDVAAFA